ncbi:hypothetical protein NKI32_16460 [Mesorhizobium sp. M0761]|uniref:hypothetical protein n=1 Tax=unclassified Mesorhizobium TaxID=325217 RepID=UPI0003CE802F|nr:MULTISPECIES: hypothetical protein [unclassified Mesorhizobium]ESY28680.1 hypothetical protein X748_28150 [Mesorhizobium sp. LNJC386A00]
MKALVRAEVESLPAETDESQAIYELEKARLENEKLRTQIDSLKEGVTDQRADRNLRQGYADKAFRFLIVFSAFSGIILIAQGIPSCPFKLDDKVVITLIGSTAVAVVGLVGWIARGLFKAPS